MHFLEIYFRNLTMYTRVRSGDVRAVSARRRFRYTQKNTGRERPETRLCFQYRPRGRQEMCPYFLLVKRHPERTTSRRGNGMRNKKTGGTHIKINEKDITATQ
jgi:hypothetical protein